MLDRVRAFLLQNALTKLISLLVAIALWGVVLGSRNIEVIKEVPISVVTASDVMVANELPERVAFRLSGPKAFLRTVVDRRPEPIRINLASSRPGLVTYRFFTDNIRVPPGVRVLSINPTAVLVKLERIETKQVPIRIEIHGAPPAGYRFVGARAEPASVRLKGPESKVDRVSEIATLPIDVSEMREPTTIDAPLELERTGLEMAEDLLPKVHLEIDPEPGLRYRGSSNR